MNYWNKFKNDKKFRGTIVVILFAILYLFSYSNVLKKETDYRICDAYSSDSAIRTGTFDPRQKNCIESGCALQYIPESLGLTGWNEGWCQNHVNVGDANTGELYFEAKDLPTANYICNSGKAILTKLPYSGFSSAYKCVDMGEDYIANKACKTWQQPFSEIGEKVFPDWSCSSQAYIVMFGALIIVLIAFSSII